MSYDWNVLTNDPFTNAPIGACDHQQSFERYIVDSTNFRTLHYASNPVLNMRAPINGQSNVQMWISDEQVQQNDPTYGWSFVLDPLRADAATDNTGQFYKIVFNKPVRIVLPLIEVSYITLQGYCLKCSTLGVLNDFKQANSGSLLHVTGTTKLVQKSFKWILTSTCPFYPTFICLIKNYVGRKLGISITGSDIESQVIDALTQMMQVQQAQQTVQTLEPNEILKDVISVVANVDPTDPTTVNLSVSVSNYSNQTAPLNLTLRMNQ
jgi:hypothetical protein